MFYDRHPRTLHIIIVAKIFHINGAGFVSLNTSSVMNSPSWMKLLYQLLFAATIIIGSNGDRLNEEENAALQDTCGRSELVRIAQNEIRARRGCEDDNRGF